MASKVESLLLAFQSVLREPWANTLSGHERVWFLVYDPAEQRKIDLNFGDFEVAAKQAGKKWLLVSLRHCFPQWMAAHKYRESYFAKPSALMTQLEVGFRQYAIDFLRTAIEAGQPDEQTLVVVRDAGALFGFVRLADVLEAVASSCRGRLLVFFPGEYSQNQYRLLDARDGWNYLARPITG